MTAPRLGGVRRILDERGLGRCRALRPQSLALLLMAGGWASQAAAQASAFAFDAPGGDPAPTRWIAAIGTARVAAEEPLPTGGVFNREEGELLQWTLGLAHAASGWTWSLELRQSAGILDYRGRNQIGLPLRTTTDLRRNVWAIVGERVWNWNDADIAISLGAGAQGVHSRRHIRATSISGELTETLRSQRWLIKTGASVLTALDTLSLRLGASAQVDRPWSQKLGVDTHGVFDPFVVRPTSRWGGTLRLEATLALGNAVDIGCYVAMQTDRPGPTASTVIHRGGAPTGSAGYPGSVQKSRLLGATLSASF